MIVDDVIKPTFAIETIKEHGGEQALVILKQALARKTGGKTDAPAADADVESGGEADATDADAPAQKKVRLTAKDLTSPEVRKFQNAIKREAPVMYDALSSVTSDPAFAKMGAATREKLLALMERVKKHEVSSEPVVDPRQTALFESQAAAATAAADATKTPAD